MNQGNHLNENSKPRVRTNKAAVLIIAVLLLLGAAVGSTVAFLITNTGPVENKFAYASVSCNVKEDFKGSIKKNVQITNTGSTDAYIRATYVVNWVDAQGNIVASVPEGYSYTLTENPDSKWTKGNDGYFYYLSPVAPDKSTPGSLLTCTVTRPENPEYRLSVEILATAIQSQPAKAVGEAWGVTISQGSVTTYNAGNSGN